MLQQLFQKYFRYARMTSLNFSKFNLSAAISNIYAQFASVSRGGYSAYIPRFNNFLKVLPVCANGVFKKSKIF